VHQTGELGGLVLGGLCEWLYEEVLRVANEVAAALLCISSYVLFTKMTEEQATSPQADADQETKASTEGAEVEISEEDLEGVAGGRHLPDPEAGFGGGQKPGGLKS
jgi:hypothetical protein